MRDRSEFSDLQALTRVLKKHPVLSSEKELALAREVKQGSRPARELMIKHNVSLVINLARKFMDRGVRLEDLVQEGLIGLSKAVDKFKPETGNRFSTYATWWIRAYLQRVVIRDARSVRGKSGHKQQPRDISIHEAAFEDGQTLEDSLKDAGPSLDSSLARRRLIAATNAKMLRLRSALGEIKWTIVRERLSSDTPKTLDEIGKVFDLSRERIRQLEVETKSFLKRALAEFDEERAA